MWRKVVQDIQHRAELHVAHAVIGAAGIGIKRPVADREIEVAGGVRREPFAGLPDAAVAAVRGGAEDRRLGEFRPVVLVGQHPAVVGERVGVMGERGVDHAVGK